MQNEVNLGKIFKGQADETPGAATGDLIFVIQQTPHPIFTRSGADLFVTKKISLLEALTGFSLVLQTIDKRWLCVKVDEIIQPGQCKAIPNEGMPVNGNKGNWNSKCSLLIPLIQEILLCALKLFSHSI